MIKLFRQWRRRRQAARIRDMASMIALMMGEAWESVDAPEPGKALPANRPEYGLRYEDEEVCITWSRLALRTTRISYHGKPVFSVSSGASLKIHRFNYGCEWIDYICELFDDLNSKKARAEKARMADM